MEVVRSMGGYLNPGSDLFEMALRSQIFVDKSGLIEKTNRCVRTLQRYICVSRPRRFGKSMGVDMLAREYYTIIRKMLGGRGFADICMIPRKIHLDKPAVVIELKWDKSAEGAIQQIKNKEYIDALKDYQGDLLLAGINYDKKTKKHSCIIEKWNL